MQVPWELLVGPAGAIVALLLWIQDLRKQRDALDARLSRIVDALEAALRKAETK